MVVRAVARRPVLFGLFAAERFHYGPMGATGTLPIRKRALARRSISAIYQSIAMAGRAATPIPCDLAHSGIAPAVGARTSSGGPGKAIQ